MKGVDRSRGWETRDEAGELPPLSARLQRQAALVQTLCPLSHREGDQLGEEMASFLSLHTPSSFLPRALCAWCLCTCISLPGLSRAASCQSTFVSKTTYSETLFLGHFLLSPPTQSLLFLFYNPALLSLRHLPVYPVI